MAECLGHLALLCPESTTGAILHNASAASPSMRQVVIVATRFMVVAQRGGAVDPRLKDLLTACLPAISDADRHVRKAALQTLTAALHHKAQLVVDGLPSLLGRVYQQTKVPLVLGTGLWQCGVDRPTRPPSTPLSRHTVATETRSTLLVTD